MIPSPGDARTNLRPLPLERLIDGLVADEGISALGEIMDLINEHERGYHELSWNVWYIDLDLDRGCALYDHDFDPYQGTFPLAEFTAAIKTRLV